MARQKTSSLQPDPPSLEGMVGVMVLVFFLFWTPVLYPLNLLVTFFHEASHALMTIITGGRVHQLVVGTHGGGHIYRSGGSHLLIGSAGYLGSLFWGVAIYVSAVRTRYDKVIMAVLGVAVLVITLVFGDGLFCIVFCSLTGVAMLFFGMLANERITDWTLRVIGLTSMSYAFMDILLVTMLGGKVRSDAQHLSERVGGSAVLWGGIWMIIAVATIAYTFKVCAKTSAAK